MQHIKNVNDIVLQNKTLERRNDELLRLVEAWQAKSLQKKPKLAMSLDMHEIENLIIRYYQVYKVPVSLYDENGKLLFSIGWKSICRFHKSLHTSLLNCVNSVRNIHNNMADVESYSFQCTNRINSVAIPVVVLNEKLGTLVVNQFLYEDDIPDSIEMKKIAYENGYNIEDYKKAIEELPVYSSSEVEKMTEHYILFSEVISFLASRNYKLLDQQTFESQKNEVCNIFKEKLEEQSFIIRTIHQYIMHQNQELEMLKNELIALKHKRSAEGKEKSLVEIQPG